MFTFLFYIALQYYSFPIGVYALNLVLGIILAFCLDSLSQWAEISLKYNFYTLIISYISDVLHSSPISLHRSSECIKRNTYS